MSTYVKAECNELLQERPCLGKVLLEQIPLRRILY
jgi:hypothetical protein